MVNTELMEQAIADSGYTKQFIADKMGITIQSLRNKVINKSQWTVKEMNDFSDILCLKNREKKQIFLI